MPKGVIKCPICKGQGSIKENVEEYEFVTRSPSTDKCLFCNGSGWVSPLKKLADGSRASTPHTHYRNPELRETLFGKPGPVRAENAPTEAPRSDLERLLETGAELSIQPVQEGREPSVIIILPNKGQVSEMLSRILKEVLGA